MAQVFLTALDMSGNAINGMSAEVLATNPTPLAVGHTYWNSATEKTRVWNGSAWIEDASGGGGVSDHGALTGLGDDDHTQYHNDARAATWIATLDTDNLSASATNLYLTTTEQAKIGHISVSQAVDLDQMEIDIAALANGMVYKGDWDASSGSFPSSADTGFFYYVSVAGTVDSVSFAIGDNIVAVTDSASTSTYAANWSKHDQTDAVQSVAGKTGAVTLDSSDVGLGNVDNTADADKPVSDDTQTELDAKTGKYSADIGNNSDTAIVVTHSLGSVDVVAQIRDTSENLVLCDIQNNSTNQTTFTFAVAPTTNQYRVTIIG